MKKLYKLQAVTNFIASGLVANFKVTKVDKVGFNDMEGNIYHVNLKVETVEGYKNKLVTFVINDTYMDYLIYDNEFNDNETPEERIENLLFCFYALN